MSFWLCPMKIKRIKTFSPRLGLSLCAGSAAFPLQPVASQHIQYISTSFIPSLRETAGGHMRERNEW